MQQQHLQAVHQHLQAQQHLLNAVNSVGTMQVHPLLQHQNSQHMQYSIPQAVTAHLQHIQQPSSLSHTSQSHSEGQQTAPNQQSQLQQENTSYTPVQMDEFPFPVFSSTILEEVNHFKPATREENKKLGETEDQVFFFGGPSGSNNSALLYTAQVQTDGTQQLTQAQTEGTHPEQTRPSGLGSSALLLHGHNSLPLLFQMPQLSGLEEDDKWILSLLNIDGIHEANPGTPIGF